MDGKINRIKVMLVDKGKTNRWLAMQDSYIATALTDGSINGNVQNSLIIQNRCTA